MKNKVFGIDLGTTYSCISYIDEFDKPVVVKNSEGDLTTPSVVFFETNGDVSVGINAKESSKIFPDECVSFIKRDMGKSNSELIINKEKYTPEIISSYILKKLVTDAENSLKMESVLEESEFIKDVVITCPAYFGINERMSTQKAGEIAGLNVLGIINEPTAAAINYGVTNNKEKKVILVYDLGGGTFDITMIAISNNEIRVICTGGDASLGGKDWDEKLLLYIDDEFKKQALLTESCLDDSETLQELYLSVEKAKKLLSSKEKATISINFKGQKLRVELTRDKFEQLSSDLLERTISLTNGMILESTKKGYKKEDISDILLVGGSSKMPQITKRIEKEYPNVSVKMFDPDEAVSKGAAIYAARQQEFNIVLDEISLNTGKSKEDIQKEIDEGKNIKLLASQSSIDISDKKYLCSQEDMKIINVTSRSFGIIAFDNSRNKKLFNLILKNDELPISKTDIFYPMDDNQADVNFVILESLSGENITDIENGLEIGNAILDLPKNISKKSKIEVSFKLNENGLLELSAIEMESKKTINTSFETKDVISEEDLLKAAEKIKNTNIN